MLIVSLVLLLLLLGFVGSGFKDGFIHTLGRLVGAVIGFVLARTWSISAAMVLTMFMPYGWARFIAFMVIYLVITRLVGWLFKLADGAFQILSFIPFLKSINSFLGALIGLIEGVLILGGLMWIVNNFSLIPSLIPLLAGSSVAQMIQKAFQFVLQFVL